MTKNGNRKQKRDGLAAYLRSSPNAKPLELGNLHSSNLALFTISESLSTAMRTTYAMRKFCEDAARMARGGQQRAATSSKNEKSQPYLPT